MESKPPQAMALSVLSGPTKGSAVSQDELQNTLVCDSGRTLRSSTLVTSRE